jgi:nitrogen fixation protein FixH
MNWGKGIVLGMSLFMAFIISMSVYMFNLPEDDYDHQYYEKGLNFDHDYARERQAVVDKAQPLITQVAGAISIEFKQPAIGAIRFANPLGKSKDVAFNINTGTGANTTIPASKLPAGKWAITIEWRSGAKNYLYQQQLFINGK